jgi:cellulose synthase/poly-beta-1,6-N-acetylglucosamine synthase-like glycosyltransferase
MMTVSVIVVAKNEEQNIKDCLNSLIDQNYPHDQYEIIVVDGGSVDRTQEIVRIYRDIKLIVDDYGTLGHQRNTGLENARGTYIVFTDADCIADKMWLQNITAAIFQSANDIAGICGPNLIMESDPPFAKIVGYVQETFFGSGGSVQTKNSTKKIEANTLPNCNSIYKSEIIKQVRYDNSIGIGEDADLNFRLKKKGFKFLYAPDAIVWHHRVPTYKKFVTKMLSYGEAIGHVSKKNRSIVRWYSMVPSFALILFLPYLMLMLILKSILLLFVLIAAFVLYIITLLLTTLIVLRRVKNSSALWTLLVLPTQHIIYGLGFLKAYLLEGRG